MEKEIESLRTAALGAAAGAGSPAALEEARVKYLGRKGELRRLMSSLKDVAAEDKPRIGGLLNEAKALLEKAFDDAKEALAGSAGKVVAKELFDVTLPGAPREVGSLHPITRIFDEIRDIFWRLGFEVADGPEIESEHYNFDALNIPPEHPSRDSFDTFYIRGDRLLRSQTSTVQIRVMEKTRPPIRLIAPGRCFRPDAVDATHYYVFHQFEGLVVDEDVTFRDLKLVLSVFARAMFGEGTLTRFRPSFFPFTEPSAELDISCIFCRGRGCNICSSTGWIELGGCGMVDPNVFEAVDYDPEKYSGYAFGLGAERTAMLKYGIPDIRLFWDNDVRFLRQF